MEKIIQNIKKELENLVRKNEMNNDLEILNHYSNIYLASLSVLNDMINSCHSEFKNFNEEKIAFICHKMTDYCDFEMSNDISFENFQSFIENLKSKCEQEISEMEDFERECFDYYFYQKDYFFSDYEDENGKIRKSAFERLFSLL